MSVLELATSYQAVRVEGHRKFSAHAQSFSRPRFSWRDGELLMLGFVRHLLLSMNDRLRRDAMEVVLSTVEVTSDT